MARPPHPGRVLAEMLLRPLGLTTARLAQDLGLPAGHIDELVQGERNLDVDLAVRLELYFGLPATWWLAHQARFDASAPTLRHELAQVVTPFTYRERLVMGPAGARLVEDQAPATEPVTVSISPDLLASLEAQVAKGAHPAPRQAKVVHLPNGSVALVGDER